MLLESVGWEGAADVSDLWRYDAILAFITAGAVIDRILAHLRRTRGDHRAALTCAPRACRRNGRDARAPVQVPVLR